MVEIKIDVANIPQELKSKNHWNASFIDKAPLDAKLTNVASGRGKGAKPQKPETWSTFDVAYEFTRQHAGKILEHYSFELKRRVQSAINDKALAYSLAKEDRIVIIDIDHCFDENGKLTKEAKELVDMFDSYTEISQSGNGLHIIVKGDFPKVWGKSWRPVEVYPFNHYVAITGNVLAGCDCEIMERQEELDELYKKYQTKPSELQPDVFAGADEGHPLDFDAEIEKDAPYCVIDTAKLKSKFKGKPNKTDADIIRIITSGKFGGGERGAEVAAFWRGEYGNDHSTADLSFCNALAVMCEGNATQIDRIFRQSGMMRDKWDREYESTRYNRKMTYGEDTITTAVISWANKTTTKGKTTPEVEVEPDTNVTKAEKKKFDQRKLLEDIRKAAEAGNADELALLMENARALGCITAAKNIVKGININNGQAKLAAKMSSFTNVSFVDAFTVAKIAIPQDYNAGGNMMPEGFAVNDRGEIVIYHATEDGELIEEFITATPFMIAAIYKDVETLTQVCDVVFIDSRKHVYNWELIPKQPLEIMANNNRITALSGYGLDVSTNNSKQLVKYSSQFLRLNYALLERVKSVDHLGWVGAGACDFVPYSGGYSCVVANNITSIAKHVSQHGTVEGWLDVIRPYQDNTVLRITLAAAFAAPLMRLMGLQCFWVHLWGATGTCKTVLLSVVASVYGKPSFENDGFMFSMNGTENFISTLLSELVNLPLCIDEMQLVKKKPGENYDKIIMQACEGKERGRDAKDGSRRKTRSWCTSIISTGEEPIIMGTSGGGAVNRVLEVEVQEKLFDSEAIPGLLDGIHDNYGTIGKALIERLIKLANDEGEVVLLQSLKQYRQSCYYELIKTGCTDKQAAIGATILLADANFCLACKGFDTLKVEDVAQFLKGRKEVSVAERAKEIVIGLIASNRYRFDKEEQHPCELWGQIMNGRKVRYSAKILEAQLKQEGIILSAVIKSWVADGFVERDEKRNANFHRDRLDGTLTKTLHIMGDFFTAT